MKKKPNKLKKVYVSVALIVVVGLAFVGLQQKIITASEPGSFNQQYPPYDTRSTCNAQSSMSEPDFSSQSIIKTENSEFKIVIKNIHQLQRKGSDNYCGAYRADYDLYKDGVLIDTVNLQPWEDLIKSKDSCSQKNPVNMNRAYSDDGTIKGELEELPSGMNGIEVNFQASAWKDGLSRTKGCRRVHVKNNFLYKLGNITVELVSYDENKIKYKINSDGNYYAKIKNYVEGKIIENEKDLIKGSNEIELNVPNDEDFTLITNLEIYKKTEDFKGTNADKTLFYPFSDKMRFNENQYFKISEISDEIKVEKEEMEEIIEEEVVEKDEMIEEINETEIIKETNKTNETKEETNVQCVSNMDCQKTCGMKMPTCESGLCYCTEQPKGETSKFYLIPMGIVVILISLIIWQRRKKPKRKKIRK